MAQLSGLILAFFHGTGADLQTVLLTNGSRAHLVQTINSLKRVHKQHIPDTKKQEVNKHTPLRQTCVSEWQEVKLAFGSDEGHRGVAPLHVPCWAHSDSTLHSAFEPLKEHSGVQQGPWLGLRKNNYKCAINAMLRTLTLAILVPNTPTTGLYRDMLITTDLQILPGWSLHFLPSPSLAL